MKHIIIEAIQAAIDKCGSFRPTLIEDSTYRIRITDNENISIVVREFHPYFVIVSSYLGHSIIETYPIKFVDMDEHTLEDILIMVQDHEKFLNQALTTPKIADNQLSRKLQNGNLQTTTKWKITQWTAK